MAEGRALELEPAEGTHLLEPNSAAPPARVGIVIKRVVGCTGMLAGAAALAAAVYSHTEATSVKMARSRFRRPFRLYEGELKMPDKALQYDGISDARPVDIKDNGAGVTSVFVLGDWGATLPWHNTFGAHGYDMKSQVQVANAIKIRAKWANPQYVLNVGDNFYVEGLEYSCNQPPSAIWGAPAYGMKGTDAFSSGWQQIYGPVANVPWLSVLGNHDYGGYRMDKGWPQQIGYSFVNHNWIMPARYYMKRMKHQGFTVDVFNTDSNHHDAKNPGEQPDHNICSHHNYGGAGTCAANGGMPNVQSCRSWFWGSAGAQQKWLEEKLAASDATWKIVNTHFPCGYDSPFYKRMKSMYGLDLLVTGHRHQQELWWTGTKSKYIQGFMHQNAWDGSAPACFVTGGGGGIAAQAFGYAQYGGDLLNYGFFHLSIHKAWMKIELVGTDGVVSGNITIHPHGSTQFLAEAKKQLHGKGECSSFCGDGNNPWTKVCGWTSCGGCGGCHPQTSQAPPAHPAPPAPPAPSAPPAPLPSLPEAEAEVEVEAEAEAETEAEAEAAVETEVEAEFAEFAQEPTSKPLPPWA